MLCKLVASSVDNLLSQSPFEFCVEILFLIPNPLPINWGTRDSLKSLYPLKPSSLQNRMTVASLTSHAMESLWRV